jgi:hypothetical protein
MRRVSLILLLLALPWVRADADAPTPAPAAATGKLELGSIDVRGIKATVELLEDMKLAIKRPFDNAPAHYDDMVCLIKDNDGFRAQGAVLECGTQGWFSMQRAIYHRDMTLNGHPDLATTANLGHPWHVERLLNHEQLAALRQVLGMLPAPGKGDVEVVTDEPPAPADAHRP